MTDWNECPDVERVAGKVSGAWLIRGTRLPVDAVLIHADEFTPEQIASEIFDGVTPDIVERVIAFARQRAPSPA